MNIQPIKMGTYEARSKAREYGKLVRQDKESRFVGVKCELCADPFDRPHIDEHGAKRWRACPNTATRQVLDEKGRTLNICEEHFAKAAS